MFKQKPVSGTHFLAMVLIIASLFSILTTTAQSKKRKAKKVPVTAHAPGGRLKKANAWWQAETFDTAIINRTTFQFASFFLKTAKYKLDS